MRRQNHFGFNMYEYVCPRYLPQKIHQKRFSVRNEHTFTYIMLARINYKYINTHLHKSSIKKYCYALISRAGSKTVRLTLIRTLSGLGLRDEAQSVQYSRT